MLGAPSQSARYLLVTADDFGLTPQINAGIIEAYSKGIVRSTALLMNGLATAEAIALKAKHPGLEVGIHLGIVEGLALAGGPNSLTDDVAYFGAAGVCLHRGWPQFIKRFLRGGIRLAELEAELDLQLQRMRDAVGPIPFANGTQHLHLLPGVTEMVLRLLRKYEVPTLRLPHHSLQAPGSWRRRAPNLALQTLGRRARPLALAAGRRFPDHFAGFDVCGRLNAETVLRLLGSMPAGTMELMAHPGHDCPYLRAQLPEGYSTFGWAGELAALIDPAVVSAVREQHIQLIQFKDLAASA